jgi:hypothetical protein
MTTENTNISDSTVALKGSTAVKAHGNSGNVAGATNGSTVTQTLTVGIKPGDLQALLESLRQAKVPEPDLSNLQEAIKAEPKAKEGGVLGEKVGGWIGGMAQKAVTGVWGIAVEKGTALLSGAIRAYYGLI